LKRATTNNHHITIVTVIILNFIFQLETKQNNKMKLSTCTNLLLGGIATMAFNAFTSAPTFVMARGSKDQKSVRLLEKFSSKALKKSAKSTSSLSFLPTRGSKGGKGSGYYGYGVYSDDNYNVGYYGGKGGKGSKGGYYFGGSKGGKGSGYYGCGGYSDDNYNVGYYGGKGGKGSKGGYYFGGSKGGKGSGYYGCGGYSDDDYNVGYYGGKGGKGSKGGYYFGGSKGGKGSGYYGCGDYSDDDYDDDYNDDDYYGDDYYGCWLDELASFFNNIPVEEISECVSTYNKNELTKSELNVEGFLTCEEDPMAECFTSESDMCDQTFYSSIDDFYDCVYNAYEEGYCFINDESTPREFFGCVNKFTDGFDDLSFDDVMDCTVNIYDVFEDKCPYFLLDDEYNNATYVPTNVPDNFAACEALDRCASSVYTTDECFGEEGIAMEEMLEHMLITIGTDVDVSDVMNAINDENYDYVGGIFEEIVTYGTKNNVTDPYIQESIMCITDNFYF